jgi:GntR family transcriptional regulator, rspAB operon transcriptional repressor
MESRTSDSTIWAKKQGASELRAVDTLADQAYQRIREMIVTGELGFGAVVSRRHLATAFGMSTLPVADALQRLENEGILESRARVGTRVKIPTARTVRGHFIVREALESQAARLFAERASYGERDELRELAALVDDLDAQRYRGHGVNELALKAHKQHMELHLKIAEYSGYRELRDAVDRIHSLIFYWLYDISAQDRNRPTQQWHRPLVEVITGTDPDAAERAMRSHIRYGMDGVLDILEPQFREGQWRLRPKTKAGVLAPVVD